jgi:hypothetical protein
MLNNKKIRENFFIFHSSFFYCAVVGKPGIGEAVFTAATGSGA